MGKRKYALQLPLDGIPAAPKPRGENRHQEAELQKAIARGVRWIIDRRKVILHASNHEVREGGEAAAKQQALLNAMGVHKGFSDLMLFAKPRIGLFMEVKLPYAPGQSAGVLSEAQEEFRELVLAMEFHHAVVRSVDDALAAIAAAGIPTRLVRAEP